MILKALPRSLLGFDIRIPDHAAPFGEVGADFLDGLRGGEEVGIAAGGVELVAELCVLAGFQ